MENFQLSIDKHLYIRLIKYVRGIFGNYENIGKQLRQARQEIENEKKRQKRMRISYKDKPNEYDNSNFEYGAKHLKQKLQKHSQVDKAKYMSVGSPNKQGRESKRR